MSVFRNLLMLSKASSNKYYLIKDGQYEHSFSTSRAYGSNPFNEAQGDGYISLGVKQWCGWNWYLTTPLDLSGYTKLYIDYECPNNMAQYTNFFIKNGLGTSATDLSPNLTPIGGVNVTRKTYEFEIPSGLSNVIFYIGDTMSQNNLNSQPINIYNIWLE